MTEGSLWNTSDLVGALGANDYLGKRLAYRLKDADIPYDYVTAVLMELSLESYIPKRPSPPDVFRRVTGKLSGYYLVDDRRHKADVIKVNEKDNPLERVIMLVEVDELNRAVSDGKKVVSLTFDKETHHLEARYGPGKINGDWYEECPEYLYKLVERARAEYHNQVNILSPQQLRDIFINILRKSGNPVKGIASLWNIPATREINASKLEELSVKLNEIGQEISFIDVIPVVNSKEQRKKMTSDAVFFATERLKRLLISEQESIVFSKNPEVQKEKSQNRFRSEAEEVMGLIEEYELLLGEALDEVRQSREITQAALDNFCNNSVQQAIFKSQTEDKKLGRRIRRVLDTDQIQKQISEISAPGRRFNLDIKEAVAV